MGHVLLLILTVTLSLGGGEFQVRDYRDVYHTTTVHLAYNHFWAQVSPSMDPMNRVNDD